jgi:hypothetical protein
MSTPGWMLSLFLISGGCLAADAVIVGTDSASGNTIISTGQRHAELLVPVNGATERVCWFDGQQYSKGARIQAGDEWLVCARENDYETNGTLSWRAVSDLPVQSGSKIQIN